ncbi:hypothetical protein IscW_ISCW012177 [Ixodes scapularis]|uniref:Transposable element P transposase-like GTP-binding insertion domain-containing protein n=1 Tax=Ixodes scapularis TaxID=6945 RepID=B7QBP6_IXOSC|nr:hypothetical protein IscW_ISCW012177 [Ixodes scapularis]|eukprot:XP_002412960.1 hypothetical protein IscW_ISCW012177 [Ixodes scapularis]
MKRKAQAVNCPAGGVGKKTKTSWAVAPVTPKIPNVEEILQDLRHRQLLADDALAALRQSLCGTPLELCVETLKNTKGPVTKARCPPELRAFAITLHFYSSSAYEYVRNTWLYIEELKKHQQRGLREGDKLRPTNLAAEVISLGVANALEFCATDLKIQTFADSEATVKFIRIFDTLYTMMNSRNRLGKGLKAPLKATTERLWKPFFEAEVYILGLKDIHGQPLHLTILKTAFVGFLLAMKSFKVRPKPPQPSGNCSTQDQTRGTALCKDTDNDALLNDHGTIRLLGMMVLPRNEDHDYADVPSIRTLALHVEDHDCLDVPNNRTLSLYVENVVEHLAVDVARTLQRDETCSDCLAVLQERRRTGDPLMPSSSVVAICKSTEKCLRRLEAKGSTSKGVVERQRLETAFGCAVLHDLLERRVQFFEDLDEHMFDTEPDDNHVAWLTKRTALCYAKIRLHHQARSALWAQKRGRMVPTP